MKNPYKKGKVHPSPPTPPPPPPPSTLDQYLSLLPATILTLTVALSTQDKQVLAYLISCWGTNTTSSTSTSSNKFKANNFKGTQKAICGDDHDPTFGCDCFRCYMSYWVRWDTSPNRQVIHEIIEAYEEELSLKKKQKSVKKKKDRLSKKVCGNLYQEVASRDCKQEELVEKEQLIIEMELVEQSCSVGQSEDVHGELDNYKGSVSKITSFIGEKIWGFWIWD